MNSVAGGKRSASWRGIVTSLAVGCAVSVAAGCGGATGHASTSQAAVLHAGVVKALVGQPRNGPWETTTVRKLRLAAIAVPHGNPDYASTIVSTARATITITIPPQGPGFSQLVVPSSGATVTADGSVTATAAKFGRKWVVQDAQFNFPPLPASVRHDPVISRLVARTLRALFTYHGDRSAYAQRQRSFYATSDNGSASALSPSGGSQPALTTQPDGVSGSLGGEDLFGMFPAICPSKSALLMLPTTMTLSRLSLSPAIKVVSSTPTVVEVQASASVFGQGWTAIDPNSSRVMRCAPSTATLSLRVAVVKSMINGHWLIGEIEDKSGICCSSGFGQIYPGLDALPN